MKLTLRALLAFGASALFVLPPALAQVSIALQTTIGPSGTNAATVAGSGRAVNFVGYALNEGATGLTATGSEGGVSFDFNTGFSDGRDRAIGSNPNSGAANVFVDLKYDSANTAPLVLDTNRNGSFADENALTGFGLHADGFITFDLAAVRAQFELAGDTAFILRGVAGIASTTLTATSAAILTDGQAAAVFDWSPVDNNTFSSYAISLSGTTRYLTFAALSGLDGDNFYAHVGFANVQLEAVPEPGSLGLLAAGLIALGATVRRRRRGI